MDPHHAIRPQSIGYNRIMAIAFIVIGALLFLLSLLTGQWISVFAGALLLALGVLMTVNPMVRIEPHEVQMRNPLGMTLKRYPVTSSADLAIEGKLLRHLPTGKRIAVLGFGVHQPDVAALRAQVPQQR